MPKKNKGYRKVRLLEGTIFDKAKASEQDAVTHQRRVGFFYTHGINPATVSNNDDAYPTVESIGDGKVRVYYDAIYLPDGQEQWPESHNGHITIPAGIFCERGGYHKRHVMTQIKYVDARLEEVL